MHQQAEPRPEVTPSKQNIHLWQFLRELLIQQHNYGSAIRWLDRSKGTSSYETFTKLIELIKPTWPGAATPNVKFPGKNDNYSDGVWYTEAY